MPPDSPISFCTSRGSSYKRSVPMLCPSNGNVLDTLLCTCPEINSPAEHYTYLCIGKYWGRRRGEAMVGNGAVIPK